jgi:disulfide bond formation protein DsbB
MDGIYLLALLTILSNIFLILYLGLWVWEKIAKKVIWKRAEGILINESYKLMLIVSGVATFGSLYLSEIRGLTPCRLCWFQRIFMYPQFVIITVTVLKRLKEVFPYTLMLSLIGGLIAIYHYFLQINPNPYAPCGDVGFSVSCSERFFTYFGYITIPWMSFSAFLIIFLISFLNLKNSKISAQ